MMALPHPSTANPILSAFQDRGFTLRRDSDTLVVTPADSLADADVAELQEWKPVLMTLRACPVLGCGQLLPWGEAAAHTCRDGSQGTPTHVAHVERRAEAA